MAKFSLKDKAIDFWYNRNVKPKIDELGIEEVRQRLYDNIYPYSYAEPTNRIKAALNNEKGRFEKFNDEKNVYPHDRDDLYAEYLNIPEEKRHKFSDKINLYNSLYKPTKGKDANYKALNLPENDLNDLIQAAISFKEDLSDYAIKKGRNPIFFNKKKQTEIRNPLNFGENRISFSLGRLLGNHVVGRNVDPVNGEYVSYYDKWDVSPYRGNGNDESRGLGTPVEIYDRIYLDDYYKIDKDKRKPKKGDYYGGYLPQVDIYKQGGRISLEII